MRTGVRGDNIVPYSITIVMLRRVTVLTSILRFLGFGFTLSGLEV